MPISYNLVSNIPVTFAYFELQAFVSTFKVYFVLFKCQCSWPGLYRDDVLKQDRHVADLKSVHHFARDNQYQDAASATFHCQIASPSPLPSSPSIGMASLVPRPRQWRARDLTAL